MTAQDPKKYENLRTVGMYAMIPTILLTAPLVGYFLGVLLQRWLHVGDWLRAVFAVLGVAAGIREVVKILRAAGPGAE
jgi:F0F1-type ATP synthase assembly protein I